MVPLPEPRIDLALIDATFRHRIVSRPAGGPPLSCRVHTPDGAPPRLHNEGMVIEPAEGVRTTAGPAARIQPSRESDDASRRRESEHWNRRRDLERQLHDGPALRIAALTLHIGLLRQKLQEGAGNLERDIDDLQGQLHMALQELRLIADQIYPPLLHEAGLGAALRELSLRARVPVRVDAVDDRFDAAVEGVAYFAVLEALDHVGPEAGSVEISARRDESGLALDLANVDTRHWGVVLDRIQRLGGAVEIVAGPGVGTIKVRIPCE